MKAGIDISSYQEPKKIDYDKLAKGIDFAILRAGFTRRADVTALATDKHFETHYKELSKRNVPLGVYWYSCASTPSQARNEVEYTLKLIKGKAFQYPVYIDTEDQQNQSKIARSVLTDAMLEFCEAVQKAGYLAGIYASENWFETRLELKRLDGIELWVANWNREPKIRHEMWQKTSKGKLDGYAGDLDLDKDFVDYSKPEPVPEPAQKGELMKAQDFVSKAKEIEKTKTIYVYGTYGRPLTQSLIDAKAKQYPSQNSASRVKQYTALLGKGYHAWDCVGLIKGILWGWDGKKNVPYAANNVPDIGANSMNKQFINPSTDFSKIEIGEAVWLSGHIGIYIGDGKVIEASPRWTDGVQITAVTNIGSIKGLNGRKWTRHGKLPWVDYSAKTDKEDSVTTGKTNTFKDVPKTHWAYEYIESLAKQGIVSGFGTTGEFRPDQPATRAQIAKMIDLAMKKK